jgi:hypothetical protein
MWVNNGSDWLAHGEAVFHIDLGVVELGVVDLGVVVA